MTDFYNMTANEHYQVNGTLSDQHIQKLLDVDHILQGVVDCRIEIDDAISSFPEEDFMSNIIDRLTNLKKNLSNLKKNLRGDNKEELSSIIDDIEDVVTSTMQSTEHGIEKLNSVKVIIRNIESYVDLVL